MPKLPKQAWLQWVVFSGARAWSRAPEKIPRHQPVCPGNPHFGGIHNKTKITTIHRIGAVNYWHQQTSNRIIEGGEPTPTRIRVVTYTNELRVVTYTNEQCKQSYRWNLSKKRDSQWRSKCWGGYRDTGVTFQERDRKNFQVDIIFRILVYLLDSSKFLKF